jgi:hypothetical protein
MMSVKNMLLAVIIVCIIWLAFLNSDEHFTPNSVKEGGECVGNNGILVYGSTDCVKNLFCVDGVGKLVTNGIKGTCNSCKNSSDMSNPIIAPFTNCIAP